jgi:excisionase family DNA binding protein
MDMMTTQQAAEKWGVSLKTVQAWIRRGKLKAIKPEGSRDWLISKKAQKPQDRRLVENPIRNRRRGHE